MNCLVCKATDLISALPLEATPLTDKYLSSKEEAIQLQLYPLELLICQKCKHCQLSFFVSPELSYENYLYQSSVTHNLSGNFRQYASDIKSRFNASQIKLLDIGSNDGSMIAACEIIGIDAMGVEPSPHIAEAANKLGRKTVKGYFNQEICKQISDSDGLFDVITLNNVLANIQNPEETIRLSRSLLKDAKSEIIIQTGYHPEQFSKGLFDYIYHEHYSYFSISSVRKLAQLTELNIVDISFNQLRGGSVRIHLSPSAKPSNYVFNSDKSEKFTSIEDFIALKNELHSQKDDLTKRLSELREKSYRIIGFGASHSTGTLRSFFEFNKFIEFVIDDNSLKWNTFCPGTAIPVYPPSQIEFKSTDVIVVLAWQHYDKIYGKYKYLENIGVTFIKPVNIAL